MAVKISGVDLSANTTANIGQAGSNGGTYTVHILNSCLLYTSDAADE